MTPINEGIAPDARGVDARAYHHGMDGRRYNAVLQYGRTTARGVGVPAAFVEDAAQEIAIAWTTQRGRNGSLPGIARRVAVDYARRITPGSRDGRQLRTVPLAYAAAHAAPDMIGPAIERADGLAVLARLIGRARLSDTQCRVLVAIYVDGETTRGTADILGVSPSAVSRQHCAALEKLRRAARQHESEGK